MMAFTKRGIYQLLLHTQRRNIADITAEIVLIFSIKSTHVAMLRTIRRFRRLSKIGYYDSLLARARR